MFIVAGRGRVSTRRQQYYNLFAIIFAQRYSSTNSCPTSVGVGLKGTSVSQQQDSCHSRVSVGASLLPENASRYCCRHSWLCFSNMYLKVQLSAVTRLSSVVCLVHRSSWLGENPTRCPTPSVATRMVRVRLECTPKVQRSQHLYESVVRWSLALARNCSFYC